MQPQSQTLGQLVTVAGEAVQHGGGQPGQPGFEQRHETGMGIATVHEDRQLQLGGQFVFASMNMLLGGMIILFVIFEPRGLVHRWNIMKESYRIWPFPH